MPSVSVILLAGGTGTRMGAKVPKQFLSLGGKPLLLYAFERFLHWRPAVEIIVTCLAEYRSLFKEPRIPLHFAEPGKTRQESLENAFQKRASASEFVCVHDAVRPFFSLRDLDNVLEAAAEHGAALLATKVRHTIKRAGEDHLIRETIPREELWAAHTPQIMRSGLLQKGLSFAKEKGLQVTDDVSLLEPFGQKIKLVPCSENNIKITTPEDLLLAERLL